MKFSNKKLLSLALTVGLLLQTSWAGGISMAATASKELPTLFVAKAAEPVEVPKLLEQNMRQSIAAVYGQNRVDEIYSHVLNQIQKSRAKRPAALLQQDVTRKPDWYKDEVIYMLYADRYGVKNGEKTTSFEDLIDTLGYLKKLGVTTLYILPFMDSPLGDAGFDVRNFKSVRDDLGGLPEFQAFITEARKQGFKIKSDLILNHISDQHAWFQAALKGDKEKMDYFIYSTTPPKYKKYNDPKRGLVVDYFEKDGKISSRSIVFPDISKTHYREVTINGKKLYFYHTFYPFQMDINWENPKVLYEVLDIISFWANQGVDIFRLDAIPYLIKTKGTNGENSPETMAVIKLLSSYLQVISPSSVIQAEAAQKLQDLLPYFGEEQSYMLRVAGTDKPMSRTSRVQIAYNFPYMSAIWASLITQDKQHFWNVANTEPQLPPSSTWATFLRVHDELTLQMVDPDTRKIVADNLEPKGAEFRKGWGVSGRMANFLDQDPARIRQAFAIMFSLPGIPIVYYGDEIGELNNFEFAKQYASQREATQRKNNPNLDIISFYDSRDVNRGPVTQDKLYQAMNQPGTYSGAIYQAVQSLVESRKSNPALTRGNLSELKSDQASVFAYLRVLDDHRVGVINNLSDKQQEATIHLPAELLTAMPNEGVLQDIQEYREIRYTKQGDAIRVQLKPYDSLWLTLENLEQTQSFCKVRRQALLPAN